MEVGNERMWKMPGVFVPQVGLTVYLRNLSKKNQKIFFAYIFELNRMEVENEKFWKNPGAFVPQMG